MFQDENIRDLQTSYQPGSTDWCLLEMKRLLLVNECKNRCIKKKKEIKLNVTHCRICNILLHTDPIQGYRVCKQCGLTVSYSEEVITTNEKQNYTWNRTRHHYSPKEHFAQTLCDFTNIGRRNVPKEIMVYCKMVLGTGLHITPHDVYNVLQSNGYRSYYQYKYEIAHRLRGQKQFEITRDEIQLIRDIYNRYSNEIIPFQRLKLNLISKRKMRIFWPVRFILSEICKEIGRDDLVIYIKPINNKKRYENYLSKWNEFKLYVDERYPKIKKCKPHLIKLKQTTSKYFLSLLLLLLLLLLLIFFFLYSFSLDFFSYWIERYLL